MKSRRIFDIFLIFTVFLIFLTRFETVKAQTEPNHGNKDTITAFHSQLNESRLPFQPFENASGIQLKLPPNFKRVIDYDPVRNDYIFHEKVGKFDYIIPYSMSLKQYSEYQEQNEIKNYWRERRRADKSGEKQSFLPSLNFGGAAFDKLFGTNVINIVPQGSAELIFGLNTTKTKNPTIPQNLQSTTTFNFQEKIQMNVTGSIGDKLKLGINYNTEASFDFENKTKLEYSGKEDEIVKKIEAGNVSLPLSGTLITGSQSLFGLKTELQFGKLNMTSVVSQQQGQSSTIQLKGGAQVNNFNIPADQYEANRHYFLSQYFRDHYESALKDLPVVNSPYTITRIEVWVTNKTANYSNARNIVAFVDLGESKNHIFNKIAEFQSPYTNAPPDNSDNGLYKEVTQTGSPYNVRDFTNVSNKLGALATTTAQGFYNDRDYEILGSARLLNSNEYTLNPRLGYISLNAALNNDEILAVAYQYTYRGKTYTVGELSANLASNQTLVVKLLKQASFNPHLPNWDLMMKNIYSLNAFQVSKDNFRLNVEYMDDQKGTNINYIPEPQTNKYILLGSVFGLDRLNSNNDFVSGGDGVFDYVEGVTINSSSGTVIFPTLQPFGTTLRNFLRSKGVPDAVANKYVYQELYDSTQTAARRLTDKDKFSLQGTYQSSSSSSEVQLNAMNIPQGSVVVTAGGQKLIENVDYTVDYSLGRVKIINQSLLASGTPISISVESNSLFNMQTKTFLGTHLDYKFNDNLDLGATILHLSERPLTQKVNIGEEPVSNTVWGLNGTYTTKSQFLTTMLDKLPLLSLKMPSTFTANAEFAQLIPGQSSAIGNTAYIDDFESSETTIDMKSQNAWSLASTPMDLSLFPEAQLTNSRAYGYNRAKLSWYVIDPLFQNYSSATPGNIKNDPNATSGHFVRQIYDTELFPNHQDQTGVPSTLPILNVAFYPKERGPYNYDAKNVNPDGSLKDPEKRWGGMQRPVPNSDFEAANIEYIEFWMMDPYVNDSLHTDKGGYLYFDLGDVSEDVLKDGRKSFENGLPTDNSLTGVDSTAWGYVSTKPTLSQGFSSSDPQSIRNQDVGLDGLSDAREDRYFSSFLDSLALISSKAYDNAKADPSSDDFHYFLGSDYDKENLGILARYKDYSNPDQNSAPSSSTQVVSSTSLPNTEDINNDNTLSQNESFFQYKVPLIPRMFHIGSGYVVDSITLNDVIINHKKSPETWYQFRIPLNEYQKIVGSIQDFKSIRFMRMFLTGFQDSVILRFAKLQFVRGEWLKYEQSLKQGGENVSTPSESDGSIDISAVNIENNATQKPVNYVLPPGISRQTDPSNPQLRQLNEQSMVLKVTDLANGDARAAYKSLNLDIRAYKHLIMNIHAEQIPGMPLDPNDLTVFLRIGSDMVNNYYEYEIPLSAITPPGVYDNNSDTARRTVWPTADRMDFDLSNFTNAKLSRDSAMNRSNSPVTYQTLYQYINSAVNGKFYVKGSPSLSNLKSIMIGVRYPSRPDRVGTTRSAVIWVDELRVTKFKDQSGWAAEIHTKTKLSDFGTLNVGGGILTPGFGSIEQTTNERSLDQIVHYDVSTYLELGKLFPDKAKVQIPMFIGYSKSITTPEYDPLNPDLQLKDVLATYQNKHQRDSIKSLVQDVTEQKSINFTNVRVNKTGKKHHFYDLSNFTLNYAFNSTLHHNINIEHELDKHYQGSLNYSYVLRPKNIAPFSRWKILRNNTFRLIRDFNFQPLPNLLSFRSNIDRQYSETEMRNLIAGNNSQTFVDKNFLWDRYYNLGWDLTRGLKIDFNATNNARIDEPYLTPGQYMETDYQRWRDTVWHNILMGGRTIHYQHTINANYNIPINKLPLLNWTNASARYTSTYDWNAQNIDTSSIKLGNTIDNSSTMQLNGQLNMRMLYNKIPLLRQLEQSPRNRSSLPKKYKTVTYEHDKTFLAAHTPKIINHKLLTEKVTVKVYDSKGNEIKGKTSIVNSNRITFTADKDYYGVKIVVTGKVEKKPSPLLVILKDVGRVMLGVKSVSLSVSNTGGTSVPGYLPTTRFLGTDSRAYPNAPGIPFLLGYQDPNFARKAMKNGWISSDTSVNNPFLMSSTQNINFRGEVEPIPGFRIELSAIRSYTKDENSYYDLNHNSLIDPIQNGTFSMSFIAAGSAFEHIKAPAYRSATFNRFLRYRYKIARRLAQNRQANPNNNYKYTSDPSTGFPVGYGPTDQDVLIPSFMAAYGNMNPRKVSLSLIPSILKMLPNWRISYNGLSKLPFFKNKVNSITLTHSYRATYNIGSYTAMPVTPDSVDMQNNFVSSMSISSVTISEQFAPLIGIDVNFKNSLSAKLEYRKSRDITLSLANSQIIENSTNELIVGSGYKINNFQVIKTAAGQRGYKTSLALRADLSIRNDKSIIRPLDSDATASGGQNALSLMLSADYSLSRNFDLRMFYDRKMNTPVVTGTGGYPTINSDIGVSARFTLSK